MARKRFASEQITGMLRKVEILLGQGQAVTQAVKHIAVTVPVFCYSIYPTT